MSNAYTLKLKPYIQPFERALAIDELKAITRSTPRPIDRDAETATDFRVQTKIDAQVLADRLAYWEMVVSRSAHTTIQSLREATVNIVRNGVPFADIEKKLPFGLSVPLPNRRCLRYGPHGIHEYRGKFFPQLVRSLLNIADIPAGGIVADPMCGSGTTAVEACLAGYHSLAMDMNPLSVEISKTKCELLTASSKKLISAYEITKERLMSERPSNRPKQWHYFNRLSERDQAYLKQWYSEQVLRDLDQITQVIDQTKDNVPRRFLKISLSNILRRVSWQKDDDLRIRKEVRPDVEIDPIRDFLEEIGRSLRFVLAFLRQNQGGTIGPYEIIDGDARTADNTWRKWVSKTDAIITSPPYATALPYLETDRLSLSFLNLLSRPEHRKRDDQMIGNREVTERGRLAYWALYQSHQDWLPQSIISLIDKISKLNADIEVGFRRRNLPALLAKYFLDMRLVFISMSRLLKRGRPAYVVVGSNHTIAGNQRVDIDTAVLLTELAESVGLKPGEHRAMEMLVSRDIFRHNTGASETILQFRR